MFGAEGLEILPSEGALLLSSVVAPFGEVFVAVSGGCACGSEVVASGFDDIVQDLGGLRSNAPGSLSFSCATLLFHVDRRTN